MSRQLLVGAAAAAMIVYPATVAAQIVDIVHIPPKAGTETDIGTTRILVTGSGENRYDKVVTSSLDAWVSVKAPDKPDRDKSKLYGSVTVEGHQGAYIATGFSGAPTIYKLTFPYSAPRSLQVANQRISPVELCNDKLQSLSGAAREEFRSQGGNILRQNAYIAVAKQGWEVRKKGSVFTELSYWTDETGIPAVVHCQRLTGPKPRDTTETKPGPKPPTTHPEPPPPPRKPLPTIAKVTLRGEPQNWQTIGGQSCPTQVRLYGFVEVRRAFAGKAIFFGPAFLNPPVNLSFPAEGSRTLTETYNAKWAPGPVKLAVGGKPAPRTQQVTLKFNIADADGKVLESAQTTETLTCKMGPQIKAPG